MKNNFHYLPDFMLILILIRMTDRQAPRMPRLHEEYQHKCFELRLEPVDLCVYSSDWTFTDFKMMSAG
jgi:hypothetical protein